MQVKQTPFIYTYRINIFIIYILILLLYNNYKGENFLLSKT